MYSFSYFVIYFILSISICFLFFSFISFMCLAYRFNIVDIRTYSFLGHFNFGAARITIYESIGIYISRKRARNSFVAREDTDRVAPRRGSSNRKGRSYFIRGLGRRRTWPRSTRCLPSLFDSSKCTTFVTTSEILSETIDPVIGIEYNLTSIACLFYCN